MSIESIVPKPLIVTDTSSPNQPESAMRRKLVQTAGVASLMSLVPSLVRQGAWAQGSDAPEKKEVKIGFIPLTDCASVVMASVLKLDEKYRIKIIANKESSWASVRDKLVNGELDAARFVWPNLRRSPWHRWPEKRHGGPHDLEQQRSSADALQSVQR